MKENNTYIKIYSLSPDGSIKLRKTIKNKKKRSKYEQNNKKGE